MKHSWKSWLLFGVPTVGFVVTLVLLHTCRRKLEVEHERLLRVAELLEVWSSIGSIERKPDGTMPTNGGTLRWERVTETWSPTTPGVEHYVLSRNVPWQQRREQLREQYGTELIERGYVTADVGANGRVLRLSFDKP